MLGTLPRPAVLAALLAAALVPGPSPGAAPPEPAAPAAKPPAKFEFEQLQLVLLLRPADRKEIPEAEAEAIQVQHLAHLTKMGESGKMMVAGPFGDQRDPSLRGACIYRVPTAEEARTLAEADPAVKSGRLRVEVVTWYVGKGYLAFPKALAPGAPTR
jgi:uncharacterized protein YciI